MLSLGDSVTDTSADDDVVTEREVVTTPTMLVC